MDTQTVRFWADIAAIFLVIQVFVLTLVAGAALGFGWWYLRKGRKALSLPFLYAQVYALRVQNVTLKVSDAIARVPTEVNASVEQVKTTAFAQSDRSPDGLG
jgi:hypothetical protein